MKKSYLWVLLTIIVLLALIAMPVFAQGESPPEPASALEVIISVFLQFAQLAGVGAAIAAVVNFLKAFKVVTDTTAGKWFAGFNLIAIAVLIYLKLFQPQIAIEYIDSQAAAFAQILLLILGYVVQLRSGMVAHNMFADLRLPYIGKSFSRERSVSG